MGVLNEKSRKVRSKDFVGKTVKSVDATASNVVRFNFTDGSNVELWAEVTHMGIPVIEVDPTSDISAKEGV